MFSLQGLKLDSHVRFSLRPAFGVMRSDWLPVAQIQCYTRVLLAACMSTPVGGISQKRDVLEHISGCTRIVPPVTLYVLGLNTLVYPTPSRI
ncbi:unnamed protein product, partial [Nesidiocoris tenuis]